MTYNESQIKNIKILSDQAFLEKIKKSLNEIIEFDLIKEAWEFSDLLEKMLGKNVDFAKNYPELFKEYQEMIIKAKFIALPLLKDEEIIKMFQENFVVIFKIDYYNVWEKLKAKLIAIPVYEERDALKDKIVQALFQNQKNITDRKIIINGKEEAPTVANWFKDYLSNLGTGRINKVAFAQYFVKSQNINQLTESEKGKLKSLFDFFEHLKISSLTPEGLEETIPVFLNEKWRTLKEGSFQNINPKIEEVLVKTEEETPEYLPTEYQKEELIKTVFSPASEEAKEELPNIGSLISQARKEVEEKLAEEGSAPMLIKSTTLTLEEITNQAERAISELKIISLNPEEKNRLKNILVSFLKGIRNSIETKDALLKSKEEGGLNFTPQQVERVFNLIKTQKPLKKERLVEEKTFGVSLDEQMKDILRPQEWASLKPTEEEVEKPSFAKASEGNKEKTPAKPIELMPPPPSLVEASYGGQRPPTNREGESPTIKTPSTPVLETFREKLKEKITSQPALSQISPLSQKSQISQPSQESRSTPPPPSLVEASYGGQRPPTDREGESPTSSIRRAEIPEIKEIKPRLEDIKRPSFSDRRPKVELVGPIEEIRNLTLADLREMSDSPDRAFEKIKGKISLLEKESFLKRIQAIKAWREGEIYRLYLEIGCEVIQKKSIIAKILKERSAKGLPILTEEEFSAIMDFNKTLRF